MGFQVDGALPTLSSAFGTSLSGFGDTFRVKTTVSPAAGSSALFSAIYGDLLYDRPVIFVTAQEGQTLEAASYAYQWDRYPGDTIPDVGGIGCTLSLPVASLMNGVTVSYDAVPSTSVAATTA